ncbi:L-lysine 6-monooxygenase (NADPH-requiring)-domain-containing protein [Butyriboletus roseoflavus]|nr:L-lysine 6-monooxygenase (NADPH-requiring)-domain-containing protein [Butyriboletus roseoflavus]
MSVNPSIQVYDVIGLGFGPSNLAIAGAFLENQLASPISVDRLFFIERHDEFKWHPAMLLPGAQMQISFLKDLATLRSPQSPLTFISYLHSQNRLLDFINRGRTLPTRKEYSDYLSWAAQYVQDRGVNVAFGEEVVALGEMDTSTIQVHSRVLSTGQHVVRLAKNLIISPGGSPRIPGPLATTWIQERMIHSSTYLTSVIPLLDSLQSRNAGRSPLRIAVIGSGQSAAEIVIDLHLRLTGIPVIGEKAHTLDLIIRKGSLKPSDDSPFVNEIFNPETTNVAFWMSSHSARQQLRLEYANANYGVVNPHTLELLYEIMYDQKLDEGISRRTKRTMPLTKPKFTILNHSEVLSAETSRTSNGGTSRSELEPLTLILQQTLTHDIYESSYDAVICATGYERRSWLRLLTNSSLGKYFGLDANAQDYTGLEAEAKLQEDAVDCNGFSTFGVGDANDQSNSPNAAMSSGSNTPASLDWASDWPREEKEPTKKICISRAYRLLPTTHHGEPKLQARIYVQGLAEETHGLSDTLLSVVGVRAGEVVDDLCKHFMSDDTVPGCQAFDSIIGSRMA